MDTNSKKISNLFNSWAGTQRGELMAKGHDELVLNIYNDWNFESEDLLLDLGCGNGRALKIAHQIGVKNLSGLDLSENMLLEAKKNLPNAGFKNGTMENIPWNDNSFSHIITIEAIYYISDLKKAFSEIARILRPDGKIAIAIDFYQENKGSHIWQECLPFEVQLLSSNQWLELINQAGIKGVNASRIYRKDFITEENFEPSSFFPSYDLYCQYQKAGALKLSN